MVSTRRGARTAPEINADPEPSLRKKPVRKAAPKPSAQTRTSRSKKEVSQPLKALGERVDSDTEDEIAVEAPKPVKKTRAPPKKAEPAKARKETLEKPKPAPRATRKRAAATIEEHVSHSEVPALPPPTRSRATRATRATAAKEKPQPLSPKKITQVSKAPLRKTKDTNTKAATRAASKLATQAFSAPAQGRNARKRGISDENAISLSETAEEKSTPATKRMRQTRDPTDDLHMSSRSTTPANSPRYNELEDEKEGEGDREDTKGEADEDEMLTADVADVGVEDSEVEDPSFDELCGPKTPMKRCSPRQSLVFAAHHSSARRLSPAKSFEVYGRRLRTPQTQRPSSKVLDDGFHRPMPMSVARAQSRAMVFSKLEPLPDLDDAGSTNPSLTTELPVTSENLEDRAGYEGQENDAGSTPMVYEFDLDTTAVSQQAQSPNVEESLAAPFTKLHALPIEDTDSLSHPDRGEGADLDTTMEETEQADDWERESVHSDASAGTVVVARDSFDASIDDDLPVSHGAQYGSEIPSSGVQFPAATPVPQTLVWANIGTETKIDVDFDSHLSVAQSLPQFEQTEQLSISSSAFAALQASPTRQSSEMAAHDALYLSASVTSSTRLSLGSESTGRQSIDATVNFSDFIDVSSPVLTPRMLQVPVPAQPTTPSQKDSSLIRAGSAVQATTANVRRKTVGRMDTAEPSAGNSLEGFEFSFDASKPHYAMPTIASRRKSLPTFSSFIAFTSEPRPSTADGLPWVTHRGARTPSKSRVATPDTKMTSVRRSVKPARAQFGDCDITETTPSRPKSVRACRTEGPKGPHMKCSFRDPYVGLHVTPFRNRLRTPLRTKEPEQYRTPEPTTAERVAVCESPLGSGSEDSPYLRVPKRKLDAHASTAMPLSRFRSPEARLIKRPATARKPISMRERAMRASTMRGTRTPTKTPLKPPALTPGLVAMTPHPKAPLKGVVAMVEVFTNEGDSASSTFVALLQRLGARTTKLWSDRITHVIFKGGSPATLQRLVAHNKTAAETGSGNIIHCVNSRWVSDCDTEGKHLDELDDEYIVDVDDVPRTTKRRRKSMEPTPLVNIGGNVVRDRKSSFGRNNLGRTSISNGSELEDQTTTPKAGTPHREDDIENEQWSPVTPAYLSAPSLLVQQTAPINRIRQLDLNRQTLKKSNRRLTTWNEGH